MISGNLGKLDFNRSFNKVNLYTYWCRVAYAEFEKWTYKEHAHSFRELHLCIGGSARIVADGIEYTLTENTFLFLNPQTRHAFLSATEDYSEFVWGFCIEGNRELEEIISNKYKNTSVMNADSKVIHSISRILDNIEDVEFGYYDVIRNEIYHIFLILARKAGVENRYIYNKTQNKEISLIRKYIKENLPANTSLEDASLLFGISKRSIENMCRKEYNITFSQLKRDVRAEVIRQLLHDTDYTMEEIAEITGFCDRYSMGKFFKSIEGQSPVNYRKGTRK